MALKDILAAITAQADKRIADARKEHQKALTHMREESERSLASKKQEVATSKKQKMEQLKSKAENLSLSHKRNAVLAKKKELLDRTYQAAIDELASLDDKELESLLRACLKNIKAKGSIHPSKKHEKLLKKICPSEQFKMKEATDAKGGFLFVSEKEEQDFTFEHLIEHVLRPETELDTSTLLFT